MKQTQMYICTLGRVYSSRYSYIAVQGGTEIMIGNYTGLLVCLVLYVIFSFTSGARPTGFYMARIAAESF